MKAWEVGQPEAEEAHAERDRLGLSAASGSEISVLVFFDPVPLIAAGVTEVQVSGTFDNIKFKAEDVMTTDDD